MSEIDLEKITFEDALSKLENLVRELEAGKIKLDDAVTAYEQAVTLKNFCEKKLNDAKLKIEKIELDSNGNIKLASLDNIDDNQQL
ncbi:MAG: exodeoxyribonuclease VII small subunit [Alphaproteobacteria bacterium]|nr:exodeoxyribonuclease VII small subunit [Alphaproteobacteria bacterium]